MKGGGEGWGGPGARPAEAAPAAPGALPSLPLSLPPSRCAGQGRRPSAAVTRPSRPITGRYQSEAGRRGRAGGHCSTTPIAVLAPPRAPLTCRGRRRRRCHSRRGLNHSPRSHFRGPRGPPTPAGCDTRLTSGSGAAAHATGPAATFGAPWASELRHRPPTPPDTLAATRDHPHGKAQETPPARPTPGPAPRRDTAQEAGPGRLGRVRLRRPPAASWVGEGLLITRGSASRRLLKAAEKGARAETNGIPTRRGRHRWAELILRQPHANQILSFVTPFGPRTGVKADLRVPWQRAVPIGLN